MILTAALMLALQAPDRNPVTEAVKYLLAHQAKDGSWGGAPEKCVCPDRDPRAGDLESTSWAILALLGAGYSELSQDELWGHNVGVKVRSGLDWIASRLDKDGAFDRDQPAANALAALVMTETYGMTIKRKETAVRAYGWIEKAAIQDTVGRIRQGMVLQSGKLAEIGQGHEERLLALSKALETQEGELARYGSLLLKEFARVRGTGKPKADLGAEPAITLPPESLNVYVTASFLLQDQDRWHKWFFAAGERVASMQRTDPGACEAGSWNGEGLRERVRLTAIRCFTLEHYRCYYCRNPFRTR
jgi:hypothetical protein